MREINSISITTRCPEHHNKVTYLSRSEAKNYAKLHQIRHGGPLGQAYRCPRWKNHWHLRTTVGGKVLRRRRRDRAIIDAWENEGGALL